MLGFLAIFAAALAGFGGLGVWAVGASAIALASLSYAEHYQLYRRGQELGLTEALRNRPCGVFAMPFSPPAAPTSAVACCDCFRLEAS